MSNLFGELFDGIDWGDIRDKGYQLSQTAKQNLIVVSAICAITGSVGAAVGLIGNYEPRVQYCDRRTNPCTKVETTLDQTPLDIETKFLPGYGLQRTAGSVLAALLFGAGLLTIAKAEEEQEEAEPKEQLEKQVEQRRLELEAAEKMANLETLSEIRTETYHQELVEAQAELMLERNPGLAQQYLSKNDDNAVSQTEVKEPLLIEESESEQVESEPDPLFFGIRLPESPQLSVDFWDWRWFNTRADDLPHIRIIAPTNGGKTTLCDWLADVVPYDERKVITVKRKPHQWVGIPVYGVPFEYDVVRDQLEGLENEMIERTRLMESGKYRGKLSAIVDEWKAIARNVKAIKDEEGKQIVRRSAKEIMGDLLTLAREPGIRIFALAQGRQVITWGLEGESDILECFATVYLGSFAKEEAEAVQRKFAKNSDEFAMWESVIEFLKAQGKRAAWVETEFGKFPAIAPDLSEWKREVQKDELVIEPVTKDKSLIPTPSETLAIAESPQMQELESNPQSPIPDAQHPIPDEDPDELFRRSLDLIVERFNLNLVQSGGMGRGEDLGDNHPELEEPENQSEPKEPKPPSQVLVGETEEAVEEKRYTPSRLTKIEVIAAVGRMRSDGMSQTKIIESLWQVQKSRSGWSQAYREFIKELRL